MVYQVCLGDRVRKQTDCRFDCCSEFRFIDGEFYRSPETCHTILPRYSRLPGEQETSSFMAECCRSHWSVINREHIVLYLVNSSLAAKQISRMLSGASSPSVMVYPNLAPHHLYKIFSVSLSAVITPLWLSSNHFKVGFDTEFLTRMKSMATIVENNSNIWLFVSVPRLFWPNQVFSGWKSEILHSNH